MLFQILSTFLMTSHVNKAIAEILLAVQHDDWWGTLCLVVGLLCSGVVGWVAICWAVVCFWFGLRNPRPSQECPNIFYQSLKIYDSVADGDPTLVSFVIAIWLTLSLLKLQQI